MSDILATEADTLALDLVEGADRPARVLAAAARVAALASRLRQQEAAAAPGHPQAPERAPKPGAAEPRGRRTEP